MILRLDASRSRRKSPAWALLAVLWAAGCPADPDATDPPTAYLEGRVTDVGAPGPLPGGPGTMEAATLVEVWSPTFGGGLVKMADASVGPGGRFLVDAPPTTSNLLLRVTDDTGALLASSVVPEAGIGGTTRIVEPITMETTLEERVATAWHRSGRDLNTLNAIDLDERIDTTLARSVASRGDRVDLPLLYEVLADAVYAAQRAEVAIYAERGITLSQADLQRLSDPAYRQLSTSLHGGDPEGVEIARERYVDEVRAARATVGLTTPIVGEAATAASAAFRGVSQTGVLDPTLDLALARAAARLEAEQVAEGVVDSLQAGVVSGSVSREVVQAGIDLRADVAQARSYSSLSAAFDDWAETLADGEISQTDALDRFVNTEQAGFAALDQTVVLVREAAVDLAEQLEESARANLNGGPGVRGEEAYAEDVIDAYLAFAQQVDEERARLISVYGGRGSLAADVLALTQGAYRGRF